ncbi:hypothetical protein GCM10008995_13990 [Halobellus salinus]|uniref:Gas vesicle structural protein n=1 Tax=Halobellus salinus TaxID=931585 RepID=A0A830EFI8_9EURY|nr:gas vesicle protein GvpJ [Halobellus salinus]GGJ05374.1 hypothetical protein GCM10008995_13990 [Halobellus salinus]SMP23317.1 Gas vesicle protein [Halobellus salinus]
MSDPKPTRSQGDLAEMVEMLLDKGVVVNADVVVSVGDTELLGIELRAAIASFETAAEYGLEFPTGTDMERVESAANIPADPSESGTETEPSPATEPAPSPSGSPSSTPPSSSEQSD